MPSFERNPLELLKIAPGDIDTTVDLGQSERQDAIAQVQQLLAEAPPGHRYCLRFAPAKGDGSETLFQPLGRLLLQARREGRISSCLPLPDGAGYYLVIARP